MKIRAAHVAFQGAGGWAFPNDFAYRVGLVVFLDEATKAAVVGHGGS